MTNQEIYDLMARFERSSIHTMKLAMGDFSIELAKSSHAALPAAPSVVAEAPAQETQAEKDVIAAPLVGTFYAAPSPEADPFVAEGSRVKKGQTVCLIEAMKMISEIPAPCDCVITEVVKKNGTLAAFGEVLFRYRPC